MNDLERSIGRIEGQMESDGKAREAARAEASTREHSVNGKLHTIGLQLATIAEQFKQYGEIKVKNGEMEVRIRSLEAILAEQAGAGRLRHWLITILLAVFGGTIGLYVGRKFGLL